MKKKVIALLLSLVLASGSISAAQVLAADTSEQEAEPVQEEETYDQEVEPVQEEEPAEETDPGNAAEEVKEQEEEAEPAQEDEEQIRVDENFETEEVADEEEFDTSEDAAAEVLETEETEMTDESEYALADVVDSGTCGNNATWALTGEENDLTLTISGSGSIYGYRGLRPWSSKIGEIKKLVVEEGITEVGEGALSGFPNLTDVSLPGSLTIIRIGGFAGCNALESITLPEGMKIIEDYGFKGCDNLTSITIPASLTDIDYDAFVDCDKLHKIYISDLAAWCKIDYMNYEGAIGNDYIVADLYLNNELLTDVVVPDGINGIGLYDFAHKPSLKSVTIPDGVTYIGYRAFEGCKSLTSVTISDGVTSMGEQIFKGCSMPPIIITHNSYVKDYCDNQSYVYFDKTAPSIVKLTSHNGSDIRVFFEKTSCISGYQIKYADNKNMTGAKSIMVKDKKAESKVITGLKNGKTYYVQIQQYLKYGEGTYWSKWSPIKSVTIGQTPYKTPISKLSTYIGSHIKVDWTKTAGASGYHIKYADNSSMTGAKEVFVKGNTTFTKTLTGLKNGKTYYVKMQTYRTVSGKTYWSAWSDVKSIKVDQTPYGSSIKKLTKESSTKMKVTWDKASSASGYHIQYYYYDNYNNRVTKDVIINGNGTLSKTITGMKKYTPYYVRIQTFRKISGKTYWSSWSKAKDIFLY